MKKLLLLLLLPFTLIAQKEVVIHIQTDNYPSETKWILYKDIFEGDTIAHVPYGHYTQNSVMNTDTIYMPDSVANISFVIYDSYGDGIINGSYYLTICGDTVIDYSASTFSTALIHNRVVPQCMPNPPPPQGPCNNAVIKINLDQYPSETSWDIKDSLGNVIFLHGSYAGVPGYQPQQYNKCLPLGELTFTIYDTYGDGMAGSLWGGSDGSYYIIQCGDTLVYGNIANFGTDSTHAFISDTCIPPPPVFGCMDENYLEFNPIANVSDSSCATLKILGCTDTTMFNYNPLANYSNYTDSCLYTLVLNDLLGNGWVGSKLQIIQDDTLEFSLVSGFTDTLYIYLESPAFVEARFEILAQASATATECGFSLTGPLGDIIVDKPVGFIVPFTCYPGYTNCGNSCEEKLVGCMDSLAFNYIVEANIDTFCYYNPGCTSPAYLDFHVDTAMGIYKDYHDQDSCVGGPAIFGCTDFLSFNYDSLANVNVGCLPKIYGCMQPLAFNYNVLANTPDTCIPLIYGCIDPTMFNYCDTCNTSDNDCEPYVFGCIDSIMFNYNPLANADNNSCVPFIYGCTDPSALNFNPQANTENFSCIDYFYGCTDSTALNYNPLANTDNGSCVDMVQGCMDQAAYNFDPTANTPDSLSCNYDAMCITGPGEPYWLNNPCYAWVINVDVYCCDNEWDNVCQATYDYCEGSWVGPLPKRINKKLISVTDILGRPVSVYSRQLLFYIYDDGTVEKKYMK